MTGLKNRISLWVEIGAALLAVSVLVVVLVKSTPTHSQTPKESTIETTLPPPPANPLRPEDFVVDGEYLSCLTAPYVLGLDVSTHQKEIDWQQVKAAGFEFVMIRLAWRGSIQGVLEEDEWAQRHYQGAKAAGLQVGGYFFSQAISPEEAVEEAEFALQVCKDWQLDMPLVFDWEIVKGTYRNAGLDARTLTDCVKAFCDTVEAAGYEPMVYFNPSQGRSLLYLSELTEYGFWLAMYNTEMDYPYQVDMWQYTDEGSVPGIDGDVDIDLFFPEA